MLTDFAEWTVAEETGDEFETVPTSIRRTRGRHRGPKPNSPHGLENDLEGVISHRTVEESINIPIKHPSQQRALPFGCPIVGERPRL